LVMVPPPAILLVTFFWAPTVAADGK